MSNYPTPDHFTVSHPYTLSFLSPHPFLQLYYPTPIDYLPQGGVLKCNPLGTTPTPPQPSGTSKTPFLAIKSTRGSRPRFMCPTRHGPSPPVRVIDHPTPRFPYK
eukprot:748925-Hanusia_phi.AAC.1